MRNTKEKSALVAAWRKSGESKAAWCKGQGISIGTLNRWIKNMNSAGDNESETGAVFAEAKVAFANTDTAGGKGATPDQSAIMSAMEVKIRILVSEKVLEIVCSSEKAVLKAVLEVVAECF
jgi:hypothetical protein